MTVAFSSGIAVLPSSFPLTESGNRLIQVCSISLGIDGVGHVLHASFMMRLHEDMIQRGHVLKFRKEK